MQRSSKFSFEECQRYSRHFVLPQVGQNGQERLKSSSVALIGLGGLGSPVAQYLTAAGVGQMLLVDSDSVSLSNLQRQVLYGTDDIGKPKAKVAAQRLSSLNPEISLRVVEASLSLDNAREIVDQVDLVIDATDNLGSRYLINDVCAELRKPFIYGSIHQFQGQVSFFRPGHKACFRCLFPDPPGVDEIPNCAQSGVLGVLPGIVGSIQAAEALKFLIGIAPSLDEKLLIVDLLQMSFRTVSLKQDPECLLCIRSHDMDYFSRRGDYCRKEDQSACSVSGGETVSENFAEILSAELGPALEKSGVLLLDVREEFEFQSYHLPGALNIPLGVIGEHLQELKQHGSIIVYCQGGYRSASAAKILKEGGCKVVRSLRGGLNGMAKP